MGSTFPSTLRPLPQEPAAVLLRWRSWPAADHKRWSWLVGVGVLTTGGFAAYLSESWPLGIFAMAGLATTLWQFFVPTDYEIGSIGLRRRALGRVRLVPWQAVRAYQLRPTGVALFQRADPAAIDLLRSVFMPYPANQDEALCAIRGHLSHALELPE
jgi:hypothetical protein